jgi:hypothetical protein
MDLLGALTVLASSEPKIDEPSTQVVFFIVGGVLAAFAVLISIVGLMKPNFPGGKGGATIIGAIAVALVAGTMFSAAVLAG